VRARVRRCRAYLRWALRLPRPKTSSDVDVLDYIKKFRRCPLPCLARHPFIYSRSSLLFLYSASSWSPRIALHLHLHGFYLSHTTSYLIHVLFCFLFDLYASTSLHRRRPRRLRITPPLHSFLYTMLCLAFNRSLPLFSAAEHMTHEKNLCILIIYFSYSYTHLRCYITGSMFRFMFEPTASALATL